MTAIRKSTIQKTKFQHVTSSTTDYCASNDRFRLKVVALGEYRVAVIGEFSPITEILKKLGGTLSDNLSHKGILYGQAYSIMKYNIPRLLRLLDEDGWEISCIKEALDNG